jgi:hypothetical protein
MRVGNIQARHQTSTDWCNSGRPCLNPGEAHCVRLPRNPTYCIKRQERAPRIRVNIQVFFKLLEFTSRAGVWFIFL